MALIRKVRGHVPEIGENTFLAETATIIGDVTIGKDCSIWYGAVLRGDGNTITIKPLLYEYTTEDDVINYTFYPSPAINSGGGQFDPLEICAEIVLTRNDSAVAPALAPSKASRKAQSIHSTVKSNVNVKERHDVYSRTDFNSRQPKYEVKKRVFNSREEQAASFWKKHKMTR